MKKLSYALFLMLVSIPAFAEGAAATGITDKGLLYIAGVFGVGLAALGGTTAQSRAASVALEGIARNPGAADKIFTPMLLSFALIESLVIFTLVSIFLVK